MPSRRTDRAPQRTPRPRKTGSQAASRSDERAGNESAAPIQATSEQIDVLREVIAAERERIAELLATDSGRVGDTLSTLLHARLRMRGLDHTSISGLLQLQSGTPALRMSDLVQPGSPRQAPLRHGGAVLGCVETAPGSALSWAADGTAVLWDVAKRRLVLSLRLHSGVVNAATMTRDRSLIASAGGGGMVGLAHLDSDTVTETATIAGHEGAVLGVAVSPDGREIVSWSIDHTLRIWDVESAALVRTLRGHTGAVRACVLLPGGQHLVSGGDDGTVRMWEWSTGALLRIYHQHTAAVVALAADDALIISASHDRTVRVWPIGTRSGTFLRSETGMRAEHVTLTGHTQGILGCSLLPNAILSWSYDRTVRIWPRDGITVVLDGVTLAGHEGAVLAVAALPDGSLVSASADRTLRVWDADSGRERARLDGHEGAVRCIAAITTPTGGDPAGTLVLSGGDDRALRLWNPAAANELTAVDGGDQAIVACSGGPDVRRVTSASRHDIRFGIGAVQQIPWSDANDDVLGMVSVPERGDIIVWTRRGALIHVRHSGPARPLFDPPLTDAHVSACIVTPDRNGVLFGTSSGELFAMARILRGDRRPEALPVHESFSHHRGPISGVAMTADGGRALSCSWDGTVKVWDAERATLLHTFEGHTDRVLAVAVSPDSKRVMTGSAAHDVRLWDIESYSQLGVLTGHDAPVTMCAFTEDGRPVSASLDGTIRVWNAAGRASVPVLRGHTDWVTGFAVDEARETLYSCSADRTVRVWSLTTGEPLGTFYGVNSFRCITVVDGGVSVGDDGGNLWLLAHDRDAVRKDAPRSAPTVYVSHGFTARSDFGEAVFASLRGSSLGVQWVRGEYSRYDSVGSESEQAMREAAVIVILVDEEAVRSRVLLKEARFALKVVREQPEKALIPVIVDGLQSRLGQWESLRLLEKYVVTVVSGEESQRPALASQHILVAIKELLEKKEQISHAPTISGPPKSEVRETPGRTRSGASKPSSRPSGAALGTRSRPSSSSVAPHTKRKSAVLKKPASKKK